MIHSKANSSNIDGRNNLNNLIENENSLNENTSSNKEPINTTNDNLNINLIAEGKISELLSGQSNDDKIINISKLDESLNINDKKEKDEKNNQTSNSDYALKIDELINDIKDNNNNTNPIVNISLLDKKFIEDKKDDDKNISNSYNTNISIDEEYANKIKSFIHKKEAFWKKHKFKKCSRIIKIYKIPIFIVLILLFISIFITYKLVS